MRILGAALLVLCGAALGLGRLANMKKTMAFLRAMDKALGLMAGEIELCARPLPELFELVSVRGDEPVRGFFACLWAKCSFMSAGEAWGECCRVLELPEGIKAALLPLGAVLGCYDGPRQCAELALVRRSLTAEAEAVRERLASKGRTWPALGACLAGVAAMLII